MPTPIPILLLLTLLATYKAADTNLRGKVVDVSDGDTITVLVDRKPIKIRLDGIDAPESGQSFGNRSKQALSDMVFGKEVSIRKTGQDRHGRSLGFVSRDGIDINSNMIEEGWAWHYKKYNDDSTLAYLERQARAANKGLWAEPSTGGQHWLNTSSNLGYNHASISVRQKR